jgi:hypothetical protein
MAASIKQASSSKRFILSVFSIRRMARLSRLFRSGSLPLLKLCLVRISVQVATDDIQLGLALCCRCCCHSCNSTSATFIRVKDLLNPFSQMWLEVVHEPEDRVHYQVEQQRQNDISLSDTPVPIGTCRLYS